jgi:hypothetical protein
VGHSKELEPSWQPANWALVCLVSALALGFPYTVFVSELEGSHSKTKWKCRSVIFCCHKVSWISRTTFPDLCIYDHFDPNVTKSPNIKVFTFTTNCTILCKFSKLFPMFVDRKLNNIYSRTCLEGLSPNWYDMLFISQKQMGSS